jgi:hypothetical protein
MTKQINKALQNLVTNFHLHHTSTVHSRFIPPGAECFSGRITNRNKEAVSTQAIIASEEATFGQEAKCGME